MNNSQDIRELLNSRFLSPIASSSQEVFMNSTSISNKQFDTSSGASSNFAVASSSSSLIDAAPLLTNITETNSKISIKRKLFNDSGEYVLVPHEGKSAIWKQFQTVMLVKQNFQEPDSPDQILTDFVACKNCKELYGKNTGTATLNRHKCASELKM